MDIHPEELKEKHEKGEPYFLIDVRESYEHEEFNIGGASMPMGELIGSVAELSERIDDEVVLYCRTGIRSGAVKEFLTRAGFKNVRNLLGGVVAWQEKFGSERLS